jgi:uncharacterized protein with FMN-binding domain
MRRAPLVLTATIAGTAGVLAFHPHAPATSTPTTTSSSGGNTATGDVIPTQYGNAQVRVTVSSGKITKVEALQLQGNEPRSVAISSAAEPILQQEVLEAQSADVDVVSGATFTSESYIQSLQSALDKLGF